MAGSVNKVMLIGRVGNDPEIKTLPGGSKVANFSVATSETWRDKSSGERKEKTEWHRVVVWGDGLVDVIGNYLTKGMLVHVDGKLQTRKWQDQSGKDLFATEIVVNGPGSSLDFWTIAKRDGVAAGGAPGSRPNFDDEIPF